MIAKARLSGLPWAAAIGVCVAGAIVSSATANHGTYLPTSPILDNVNGFAYGGIGGNGQPLNFMEDVYCEDEKIGEIRFNYDIWTGTSQLSGNPAGGAALSGGFWLTDPNCQLQDGWQFGWVQIVKSTISGGNVWNAPNDTWFPDTVVKTDPDYPGESLSPALNPQPNPLPNVGYTDFPTRFPHQGNLLWEAELALVCKNLDTHEMRILGGFFWGFEVVGSTPGNPTGSIIRRDPAFWGPNVTQTFRDTITNSFNGQNGSTAWTIGEGCCCAEIPEPVSAELLAIGLLVVTRRRRSV